MPAYLSITQGIFEVLCLSCLIFVVRQWRKRASETGFTFGQTATDSPLLVNELLILLGSLLLVLSCTPFARVFVGMIGIQGFSGTNLMTNEQQVIFNFASSFMVYLTYFGSLHLFFKKRSTTFLQAFGLNSSAFRNGWIPALVGLGGAFIPVGIASLSAEWLFKKIGYPIEMQNLMKLFLEIENPVLQLAIAFIAIVGAPIVEETLFRGILYPTLKKRLGFGLALLLTSTLFAAIHFHALTAFPLTILAICLTLVYEWRGNLSSCILMHALFNLSSLIYSVIFLK